MCEECKSQAEGIQKLIDAVEINREALVDLLEKIHQDMGQEFIVFQGENGEEIHFQMREVPAAQVLLLNYLAAFITGETRPQSNVDRSATQFYRTGLTHGATNAGARQITMN